MTTHRSRDSLGLTLLLFAGTLIGLGIWAADDLKAWLRPLMRSAAIQTSALGHCAAPSEGEHLVVVLRRQGERVQLDSCLFAGSRGTYRPLPR